MALWGILSSITWKFGGWDVSYHFKWGLQIHPHREDDVWRKDLAVNDLTLWVFREESFRQSQQSMQVFNIWHAEYFLKAGKLAWLDMEELWKRSRRWKSRSNVEMDAAENEGLVYHWKYLLLLLWMPSGAIVWFDQNSDVIWHIFFFLRP